MKRRVGALSRFQLRDVGITHTDPLSQRPLTETQFRAPLLNDARQPACHNTNFQLAHE